MKIHLNIIYLFLIWAAAVFLILYFGFVNFPKFRPSSRMEFLPNLANWDGGHYLSIAQSGYVEEYKYAFFPLYPLTINLVNRITHNYLYAALLISLLSSMGGVYLFYKLIAKELDRKIALDAVILLLIFPTAFYFLVSYSEGLFFLLTMATFYNARKNNLKLATLCAALASATRLVGLTVGVAFILQVVLAHGFKRKNWFMIFSFSGLLFYCGFLYLKTQDPLYFLTAQLHWQRSLGVPGVGFWDSIQVLSKGFSPANWPILQNLLFAIFGLGIAIRAFRFLPRSYATYALLSVGIPLLTPTLSSIPRFLLPIFPIFILLAQIRNQYLIFAYRFLSPLLLAAFAILYINGYFVS